jgi:hypothetical protein
MQTRNTYTRQKDTYRRQAIYINIAVLLFCMLLRRIFHTGSTLFLLQGYLNLAIAIFYSTRHIRSRSGIHYILAFIILLVPAIYFIRNIALGHHLHVHIH